MEISVRQLFVFAFVSAASVLRLRADPIQDLKQSLAAADPSIRAVAIEAFNNRLCTADPYAPPSILMKSAIPLLMQALRDPEAKVRESAINGLLVIAVCTSRVIYPPIPNGPDLTADPSNQESLLKATSDPDEVVRLAAFKTYAATYKLTSDLENKIIAEFNAPDSTINDPAQKVMMIACLMMSGSPSSKVQDFLSHLVDDPKYGVHVAEQIGAGDFPLSSEILRKLFVKLGQDKDPVSRAAYVRAIGAYGKRAQLYVPELQRILAAEKQKEVKDTIKSAIDKINK
jgi:hypothetical protein